MGEVIPLGAKEAKEEAAPLEYVWTCYDCGGQSFQLLSSGTTCCVRCGKRACDECNPSRSNWRSHLPELPLNLAEILPLEMGNVITDHPQTPVLAIKRFVEGVQVSDPVALCMIDRDGHLQMWGENCENEERQAWFKERLEIFATFVLALRPRETPPDA